MRLALLSRNRNLHSIRRLIHEAAQLGVECTVLDPLDLQILIKDKKNFLLHQGNELPKFDAVLPRIGTSITEYGLAIVRQFECMGTYVVNGSKGIASSRDKFLSLQVLSQVGLRTPATALIRGSRALKPIAQALDSSPLVMKLLRGTQGLGVMLVHSSTSGASVLDTFESMDRELIVQRYMKEGAGRDYRLVVVGDKIVGTMERQARRGEFRSNIHRGGDGHPITLPQSYRRMALKAAKAFSLGLAGVDIMEGPEGPVILEVNSTPGFEGLEKATHRNIGAAILRHIVVETRKQKRLHKRRGGSGARFKL